MLQRSVKTKPRVFCLKYRFVTDSGPRVNHDKHQKSFIQLMTTYWWITDNLVPTNSNTEQDASVDEDKILPYSDYFYVMPVHA